MINKLILVVDDEIGIRELLSEILTDEGYEVKEASDAGEAREMYVRYQPQLVLLDIWMPGEDGVSLLKEWREHGQLDVPVVMMSGHATVDMAVEATRMGAFGFLEKPIALPKLLGTVARAMESAQHKSEEQFSFADLGSSQVIADLRDKLKAASHRSGVFLLIGEHGSGLDLAAQKILKPDAPMFVSRDYAWLEDNPFLPLEAFQHGGILIEDIESLSLLAQKGLLLLMEKLERYDMRLMCGSRNSLEYMVIDGNLVASELVEQGVEAIRIPALREHVADLPDICRSFLGRMTKAGEIPRRSLSSGAISLLGSYPWPGNLPELANSLRTLALTSAGVEIAYEDVRRFFYEQGVQHVERDQLGAGGGGMATDWSFLFDKPLRQARDSFEKLYLEHHLREARGNMSRVAEHIGLERTHLYRKLRQLGIENMTFRGEVDKPEPHDET